MNGSLAAEPSQVIIESTGVQLAGDLVIPRRTNGAVVFAHGSGSSRRSSRNRFVAKALNEAGLATLLFDLLTAEEGELDEQTRELRFDIPLLSRRLIGTIDWIPEQAQLAHLKIGLFGASTGAAAALVAAADRPDAVHAVVSRGGRPDLAPDALQRVKAPTLLIVGGRDDVVMRLNEEARRKLRAENRLDIVPGATHLFEEPGALEQVASLASEWFNSHLRG